MAIKLQGFTEKRGLFLLEHSPWANRYFKSIKQFKIDRSVNKESTEWRYGFKGRTPLYDLFELKENEPVSLKDVLLSDTQMSEPNWIKYLIEGWGREGETYQEIFDALFCEEMFIPEIEVKDEIQIPEGKEAWKPGRPELTQEVAKLILKNSSILNKVIKHTKDLIFTIDDIDDNLWSELERHDNNPDRTLKFIFDDLLRRERFVTWNGIIANMAWDDVTKVYRWSKFDSSLSSEIFKTFTSPVIPEGWTLFSNTPADKNDSEHYIFSDYANASNPTIVRWESEWCSHPGGESTSNCAPCWVDVETGYPISDDPYIWAYAEEDERDSISAGELSSIPEPIKITPELEEDTSLKFSVEYQLNEITRKPIPPSNEEDDYYLTL